MVANNRVIDSLLAGSGSGAAATAAAAGPLAPAHAAAAAGKACGASPLRCLSGTYRSAVFDRQLLVRVWRARAPALQVV